MSPAARRQRPEEAKLEALAALDPATDRGAQSAAISAALRDAHHRVVAKAATLAGERAFGELIPELLAAYSRFLMDPVKRDPRCLAKAATSGALVALECPDVEFWLAGIRYRQLEPSWGGSTDTAVDIRCNCALGLVNTGYLRALPELAGLLIDPEKRVRAGAVKAISCGSPREAEPLLRFKTLSGDAEPDVMGECFSALLAIAPEESMQLVAMSLGDRDEAVRDYAALALGESRHPAALEHLQAAWNEPLLSDEFRTVLARAAAVHRSEAAFAWLLGVVETGAKHAAAIAADALRVYDRNVQLRSRLEAAMAARQGP